MPCAMPAAGLGLMTEVRCANVWPKSKGTAPVSPFNWLSPGSTMIQRYCQPRTNRGIVFETAIWGVFGCRSLVGLASLKARLCFPDELSRISALWRVCMSCQMGAYTGCTRQSPTLGIEQQDPRWL